MFNIFDNDNSSGAMKSAQEEITARYKRIAEQNKPENGPFHEVERSDQDLIASHSLAMEMIDAMIETCEARDREPGVYEQTLAEAADMAGAMMTATSIILGTTCGYVYAANPKLMYVNPLDMMLAICLCAIRQGANLVDSDAAAMAETMKSIDAQEFEKGIVVAKAAAAFANANEQSIKKESDHE